MVALAPSDGITANRLWPCSNQHELYRAFYGKKRSLIVRAYVNIANMKAFRLIHATVLATPLIAAGWLGLLLTVPAPAQAACGTLSSSLGTVSVTVNTPSSGSYRVWVREMAPSSTASSFYAQIPDANICSVSMGGAAVTANSWVWIDYENANPSSTVNANLSAGNHTVELAGQSSGLEVDKVLLLSDATCTPTGDGSNCTAAAVTATPTPTAGPTGSGSTPSPSATPVTVSVGGGSGTSGGTGGSSSSTTPTVSGEITLSPTGLPAGSTNIQYYVDGTPVPSGMINTNDLSNGTHTITVTATGPNGQTITRTSKIIVDNKHSLLQTVTAFIQAHRTPVAIVGVAIIAIPLGLIAASHFGLLGGGAATVTTGAGSLATAGAGMPGMAAPDPAAGVFQAPPSSAPNYDPSPQVPQEPSIPTLPQNPVGPTEAEYPTTSPIDPTSPGA